MAPSPPARLTTTKNVPYIAQNGDLIESLSASGLINVTSTFSPHYPWRTLFAAEIFGEAWNNKLPNIRPSPGQASALAQAQDELTSFCAGVVYRFGPDFHPIEPLPHDMWELKTPNVRIYGWFSARNLFVAYSIGDADFSHGSKGYKQVTELVKEMASFRNNLLGLASTRVSGKRVEHVLSNRI